MGANPTTDAHRALRARQLTTRRHRNALACGLRRLATEASEPPLLPPGLPLNRKAVQDAHDSLLELASRLAETDDPCPRSAALASYLVCDPTSPAYNAASRALVVDLALSALAAIDHQPLR